MVRAAAVDTTLVPGYVVEVQRRLVTSVEYVGTTESELVWSPAVMEAWVGPSQVRVRFLDRLSGFVTAVRSVRPATVVQDLRWPVRPSARTYWKLVWEHEIQRDDGITSVPAAGAMSDLKGDAFAAAAAAWGRIEPIDVLEDALNRFKADAQRAREVQSSEDRRERWLQQHAGALDAPLPIGVGDDADSKVSAERGASAVAAAAAAAKEAQAGEAGPTAVGYEAEEARGGRASPVRLLDGDDALKGVLIDLALSPLRHDTELPQREQVRIVSEASFPAATKQYTVDFRAGRFIITFHVNRKLASSTRVRRRLIRLPNPPNLAGSTHLRTKAHAVSDALRALKSHHHVIAALTHQQDHAVGGAHAEWHRAAAAAHKASAQAGANAAAKEATQEATKEATKEDDAAAAAPGVRADATAIAASPSAHLMAQPLPVAGLSTAELSLAIEMRHSEETVLALLEANPGAAAVPGSDGVWPFNAALFAHCYSAQVRR